LSVWGVLAGINLVIMALAAQSKLVWLFNGGTPLEFPLLWGLLHIVYGIVFTWVSVKRVRSAIWRIIIGVIAVLMMAAMVFFNYKVFMEILYVS